MKKVTALLGIMLLLAFGFMLTGCGGATETKENSAGGEVKTAGGEAKTVLIEGSTTVEPLAKELAKEFKVKNANVDVTVVGNGSDKGIAAANEAKADIGTSSRNLKEPEKAYGLKEFPIAIDSIVIIVNPKNKVENLTIEQLKGIYSGKIKNWKEVGGDDKPIKATNRQEASGTRGYFKEAVLGKAADAPNFAAELEIISSDAEVNPYIEGNEDSIGFVSLAEAGAKVKILKVEGVEATKETVKSGKYKLSRPLILLTKEEPKDAVKAFIDFAKSEEGKKIINTKYLSAE